MKTETVGNSADNSIVVVIPVAEMMRPPVAEPIPRERDPTDRKIPRVPLIFSGIAISVI